MAYAKRHSFLLERRASTLPVVLRCAIAGFRLPSFMRVRSCCLVYISALTHALTPDHRMMSPIDESSKGNVRIYLPPTPETVREESVLPPAARASCHIHGQCNAVQKRRPSILTSPLGQLGVLCFSMFIYGIATTFARFEPTRSPVHRRVLGRSLSQ